MYIYTVYIYSFWLCFSLIFQYSTVYFVYKNKNICTVSKLYTANLNHFHLQRYLLRQRCLACKIMHQYSTYVLTILHFFVARTLTVDTVRNVIIQIISNYWYKYSQSFLYLTWRDHRIFLERSI